MTIRIKKWGNSFGVRIPKNLVDSLYIKEDTSVKVFTKAGRIIIEPTFEAKKPTLESLVSKITKKNRHEEIDWGGPVGKEIW